MREEVQLDRTSPEDCILCIEFVSPSFKAESSIEFSSRAHRAAWQSGYRKIVVLHQSCASRGAGDPRSRRAGARAICISASRRAMRIQIAATAISSVNAKDTRNPKKVA